MSLLAQQEAGRIDMARLRADRRRRLMAAMAAHDLDAMILGRAADVAFASGARQLWTAGARPFGPACIVLREGGQVHLLSTWDEGVPAEIEHSNLFGLKWNPANLLASLATIPDASTCCPSNSSPRSVPMRGISALSVPTLWDR